MVLNIGIREWEQDWDQASGPIVDSELTRTTRPGRNYDRHPPCHTACSESWKRLPHTSIAIVYSKSALQTPVRARLMCGFRGLEQRRPRRGFRPALFHFYAHQNGGRGELYEISPGLLLMAPPGFWAAPALVTGAVNGLRCYNKTQSTLIP
ncbi:hypothetical protein EVAR_19023_1 [Eumeta japonica]|uniref:Uncharacterized protein n=1 Tax=Eumeta variegata TaxID=151549 RepID=A0A4C1V8J6_EUMVA|nr:hypothetical protein EVAR_19023_1 [Eumeta japonica]